MSIAALYDIHANLPALEAVLEEVRRENVDLVVVGGDVFPGPMPTETIDRLLVVDVPVRFIMGNGDFAVLQEKRGRSSTVPERFRPAVRWVAEQLRPEHELFLTEWPEMIDDNAAGLGKVLFCHATPRSQDEIFTGITSEAKLGPVFNALTVPLVICGHTHMQFDRRVGDVRVVNAGSVGSPYGEPGAYWLLLDGDAQLRKTRYDYAEAAARIRATKYPLAEEFVTNSLLTPPSVDEMLRVFSNAELR